MEDDKEIRYYIDIDARTKKVLRWDRDFRANLSKDAVPGQVRIFLTKGQYSKLVNALK
ncbi:MAG: hypothetical protein QCI82_01025 [Candidatus Thermoplasmatota archaeon]|nr:hypothetical protein [Candidatus Thermoplasmatota archaeon]